MMICVCKCKTLDGGKYCRCKKGSHGPSRLILIECLAIASPNRSSLIRCLVKEEDPETTRVLEKGFSKLDKFLLCKDSVSAHVILGNQGLDLAIRLYLCATWLSINIMCESTDGILSWLKKWLVVVDWCDLVSTNWVIERLQ